MKLYYRLRFFIVFTGIFVIGLLYTNNSFGLTFTEVETYTKQALNDYLRAQGWTDFNHAVAYGDLVGISSLLNQNVWAIKKQDINFEDYNSFYWSVVPVGSGYSEQIYVILQLYNDLSFSISAGNSVLSRVPVNIINCTTDNRDNIYTIRFRTPHQNTDTFEFVDIRQANLTTDMNRYNYRTIFYTTGEIYNTNNLLFFGGKLNSVTPLEFENAFEDHVTNYQNTSVNYVIGDAYLWGNKVRLGTVKPNDAVYYEFRLFDTTNGIGIGSYYNRVESNDTFSNNAIYGQGNDIYLNTRYISYNHIYKIEITYIYEYYGEEHYLTDYIVFFPQRKCS